jgi:hypothetical protein
MRGNNDKYKLIKKTPQSLLKGSKNKTILATYKKSLAPLKKYNFSVSSNEEFSCLKLKKMLLNKEKKIEGSFNKESQRLSRINLSNNKSKQNLSQKLPKYSIKSGKSVNILENKQKNKVESLFKKSKFKKTIIIDGEGNNNLNLNKFRKNHTSHKLHLLNVKDKTKQSKTKTTDNFTKNKNYRAKTISQKNFLFNPKNKEKKKYLVKPIVQIRNKKRCLSSKNDAIMHLINIYKNDHFDTISSTFTETNSLFVKSNNLEEKRLSLENYLNIEEINENKYNFDKKDENKIINEYNKKKQLKINEISDYTTFFNDLQKNEIKNNMDDNNKENITNNNSIELISFMESSIQDDIYQTLLKNNSKEINQKEDSFNLNQSIAEFDKAVKRNNNYEFENIIHLPMKNNNQSENIHILDKIENQNTKENLSKIQKSDENKKDENENHLCIIF